jgi:hypothetical protein
MITPAPVRTRGTIAAEPLHLAPPGVSAKSLSTGPIVIPAAARARTAGRRARAGFALAALALAATVALQITAQRSDAAGGLLPFAPLSAAPAIAPQGTTAGRAPASASSRGTLGAAPHTAASQARTSASGSAPTTSRSSRRATAGVSIPPPAASTSGVPAEAAGAARPLAGALSGGALPSGVFRFSDFGSDLLGLDLTGRLTGAGSGSTTIEMTPNSSSKRSRVPTKHWTTNQLSLVKVSDASEISGFTLKGTDQGHLYNGLRVSRSTNPRISDVRVLSIPGGDDIPPGETFGINDYRTDGATYSNVEVDGSSISGAAFGTNDSNDVTVSGSSFHDAGHSNGATFWQTRNVTVRNTTSVDNKDAAFNFERVSGTVVLDHVTMRGNRLSDLRIDSDQSSATYRIIDPVLDGKKLTIVMTPRYMGHANVQRKSDVHVIVGGVDRTAALVTWVDHF